MPAKKPRNFEKNGQIYQILHESDSLRIYTDQLGEVVFVENIVDGTVIQIEASFPNGFYLKTSGLLMIPILVHNLDPTSAHNDDGLVWMVRPRPRSR